MAISLSNARAAMLALGQLDGVGLFAAMKQTGGYLFSKHQNRAIAFAAAKTDHEVKGYVKKLVTKEVENLTQYKLLTGHEKKGLTGLTKPSPKAKDFGKNKPISSTATQALGQSDYTNLLLKVVETAGGGFYQAGAEPNTRFLYVINMPPNYVGRSIDEHENKCKGLPLIVLIVVAQPTGNPYLMNMFPAAAGYLTNKTALV